MYIIESKHLTIYRDTTCNTKLEHLTLDKKLGFLYRSQWGFGVWKLG